VAQRLADGLGRRGNQVRGRAAEGLRGLASGRTGPTSGSGPAERADAVLDIVPVWSAASGFAFAAAIGRDQPWPGLALRFLAAAVAYSRVHTGVHYPGEAVVGALIGEAPGRLWPA
jgi:hypothetical protein